MLLYFQTLLEFTPQLHDDKVQELIPVEDRKVNIQNLCGKSKDVDSITKKVQSDETTLSCARLLSDVVIQQNRPASSRLEIIECWKMRSLMIQSQTTNLTLSMS